MKYSKSFQRKVIYLCAIVVLLFPLYLVGSPDSLRNGQIVGGGWLSRMRTDYKLAQTGLGEIDPTGEAMKLATLGMQGVAVNILWSKSNYYKKTEQFDKMNATVNQMLKLAPNYIAVWEFHAHNMSYNTSVEFDDYRFRYNWVKRGISFLIGGTEANRDNPQLLWQVGWFFEQKIGKSDEYRQFRPMFREDKDFHETLEPHIVLENTFGPDNKPDNWLVGYEWMDKARSAVDDRGKSIRGRTPLVFHASPSMAKIYYAAAIEEEGAIWEEGAIEGEAVAALAWKDAGDLWEEYGDRPFRTSAGLTIRMNDLQDVQQKIERLEKELETATKAEAKTKRMESRLERLKEKLRLIEGFRDIINYAYWETRCKVEQDPYMIRARKYVYQADQAAEKARFVEAKEKYELAWDQFAEIFERFPILKEDVRIEEVEQMIRAIDRYRQLLKQLDEEMPDDFKLQMVEDLFAEQSGLVPPKKKPSEQPKKPSDESPEPSEEPSDKSEKPSEDPEKPSDKSEDPPDEQTDSATLDPNPKES